MGLKKKRSAAHSHAAMHEGRVGAWCPISRQFASANTCASMFSCDLPPTTTLPSVYIFYILDLVSGDPSALHKSFVGLPPPWRLTHLCLQQTCPVSGHCCCTLRLTSLQQQLPVPLLSALQCSHTCDACKCPEGLRLSVVHKASTG